MNADDLKVIIDKFDSWVIENIEPTFTELKVLGGYWLRCGLETISSRGGKTYTVIQLSETIKIRLALKNVDRANRLFELAKKFANVCGNTELAWFAHLCWIWDIKFQLITTE